MNLHAFSDLRVSASVSAADRSKPFLDAWHKFESITNVSYSTVAATPHHMRPLLEELRTKNVLSVLETLQIEEAFTFLQSLPSNVRDGLLFKSSAPISSKFPSAFYLPASAVPNTAFTPMSEPQSQFDFAADTVSYSDDSDRPSSGELTPVSPIQRLEKNWMSPSIIHHHPFDAPHATVIRPPRPQPAPIGPPSRSHSRGSIPHALPLFSAPCAFQPHVMPLRAPEPSRPSPLDPVCDSLLDCYQSPALSLDRPSSKSPEMAFRGALPMASPSESRSPPIVSPSVALGVSSSKAKSSTPCRHGCHCPKKYDCMFFHTEKHHRIFAIQNRLHPKAKTKMCNKLARGCEHTNAPENCCAAHGDKDGWCLACGEAEHLSVSCPKKLNKSNPSAF